MNGNKAIENYILTHISGVLKPPIKNLKYPFIVPGEGYMTELWSWDAYWESLAIKKAFEKFGDEKMAEYGVSRQKAIDHIRGSVLDFLDAQEVDGFIPTMISAGGLFENFFRSEYEKGTPMNQCLPFLCQFVVLAGEFSNNYDFDAEKLLAYMRYYENKQKDKKSGLFFWQNDVMIGVDNNPTVFYRPQRSGADIYLNSFIYLEYIALAKLLEKQGDARAENERANAEKLKAAINAEAWDERDGIYYSQDIDMPKTEISVKGVMLHSGLDPHWNGMPLKIRFWGCFLPMYAGICNDEKATRMCAHLTENDDLLAKYGIRTLAKNEKMYSLAKSQGNPSNWLGAVWVIADYCVYKGLAAYNKTAVAEKVRRSTINLLNENLKKYGDFFESYNPDTGEPFMHPGFLSHNLPVIDML